VVKTNRKTTSISAFSGFSSVSSLQTEDNNATFQKDAWPDCWHDMWAASPAISSLSSSVELSDMHVCFLTHKHYEVAIR